MGYRNDIQGLRAIAFLLVFIFHLNSSWLPAGFLGVDIFFVISGYLITSIILHKKEKNKFSIMEFYEGRLKRIAPAYYFLLMVISILGFFIYLPMDLGLLRRSLITAGLFVSNFFFATGDSYFGAKQAENPLLHTWSLGIEMQFYFLLPIILIFFKKKYLPYILAGIISIILAYYQYRFMAFGQESGTYYSLLARIPEFLIGAFMSVVLSNGQVKNKKYSLPLALSGVSLLIYGLMSLDENSAFPGINSFLPCLGIGLILISNDNFITRLLASKPLVYIGTLSYSLYLWHWPLMAFQRYREGVFEGHQFDWKEILTISILTFVLSWLSYTFIENSIRQGSTKKFLIKFTCIVVPFGIATYSLHWLSKKFETPYEFTQASFATGSHNVDHVDTLGDRKDKRPHVLLLGNSHANSIKPLFNILGEKFHFSINTLTSDSFPALEGIDKREIPEREMLFYNLSRALVPHTKELIASSEVIIISADSFDEYHSVTKAVDSLAKALKPNQQLVLINSYPIVDRNPVRINHGFVKNSDYKFKVTPNTHSLHTIDSIARVNKNVLIWDISKASIYNDAPYYKDTLIYYDDRHINRRGAILLEKEVEDNFKKKILPVIQN